MSEPTDRDAGYDDWLDAVAADEAYYLECPNGHGSLPPRRACPACGDRTLSETPLPETGDLVTFTVVHIAAPQFGDDVPYVTGIADFGPVRLTGLVRGVEPGTVETGLTVSPAVGETETTGDRALLLEVP